MDVNTVHTTEFVKENRNPDTGAVTSLTIKLSAFAIPAEVSYTGDGEYLNHNDTTYNDLTIVGKEYYDYDLFIPFIFYMRIVLGLRTEAKFGKL